MRIMWIVRALLSFSIIMMITYSPFSDAQSSRIEFVLTSKSREKDTGICVPQILPHHRADGSLNSNNSDESGDFENSYVCNSKSKANMDSYYEQLTDEEWVQKSKLCGVPQRIDGSEKEKEAARNVLKRMDIYFREEVTAKMEYAEANSMARCQNHNELCAFWASVGECESNRGFMVQKCTAACRLCLLLHLQTNRFTFHK